MTPYAVAFPRPMEVEITPEPEAPVRDAVVLALRCLPRPERDAGAWWRAGLAERLAAGEAADPWGQSARSNASSSNHGAKPRRR